MSKTLYISDLDGTLLTSSAVLSEYTIDRINTLVEQGMNFTFATARTIYSAARITQRLKVNVPCILNNGASIYDIQTGQYVKNAYIKPKTALDIVNAMRSNGARCFVFKFVDGKLTTCFDELEEKTMRDYAQERMEKFDQPFIQCSDVADELDGTAIYINTIGDYEALLPIRNAVLAMKDADCAFYRDTYTKKWYLEVFSSEASKGNGVRFLRENYGFDKIVAFGDNLNDISMFEQSDMRFAVKNANVDLKIKADMTIDSNNESGVANFLINNYDLIEAGEEPEMPVDYDDDDDDE